MSGSIQGFQFGIDLMFDIRKREGRNVLDLAVLVRRSSELPSQAPQPAYLRPPPGTASGGGSSIGPFTLQFWLPQRELWVNGVCVLVVPDNVNVVLLDEQAGALVLAETAHVTLDFEAKAVSLATADPSPLTVWSKLLRQAFARSPQVRSFMESSAHPAFEPLPTSKSIRGRDFAPGIDSWYHITTTRSSLQLDCVVLVKLSEASRDVVAEPLWRRAPPFDAGHASGTLFGSHAVVYQVERGVLWVDGVLQPKPLAAAAANAPANVYMFRERNGSLELAGMLTIDRDPRVKWRERVLGSAEFKGL